MTFAQPFTDYEILDRVGAGAMGTVFKARHKRLNRIVALKVLKPSLARDSRYVDRLRREARIVASLNHPYIVSGYDLGDEGGYHFFVMEFVEGKSLRGLLLEWGMFAEEYVRRVARQVAMALDHAYQRGVIHRDIKPGNILIDDAGNVKLTDMGLAKGPADLTLTRDGATVGTPQDISPEQARNPHDVDVRTDLYSLGATLYHMAAGVPPYRGDTMAELITNVLSVVPTPPNELNPALSEGLSLVIRKLLVKDVTVRYQTPQELLDDLDRIDRAQPPKVDAARLQAGATESSPWFGRTLLSGAVALLIGIAWWVGMESREPAVAGQAKDEFLQALDAELQRLPTPGARQGRLDAITIVPTGAEAELLQRRRTAGGEVQSAIQQVVDGMLGAGWRGLVAWMRDPIEWPDRSRVERERIAPSLNAAAGIPFTQLASNERVRELLRAVDRALHDRDLELVTRFGLFLATTLPSRAEEQRRVNDFAAAARLWDNAMSIFFESVRLQPLERLSDDVRRRLREKHELALEEAKPALAAAESEVRQSLLDESSAVVAVFSERLREGTRPAVVRHELQRYREELGQMWPAAPSFRPGQNPWPRVDQMLSTLEQGLSLAEAELGEQRFERRLDLAWRALCRGTAADALQVLLDTEAGSPPQAEWLSLHRRALEAAGIIEVALLDAISRASQRPVAFLVSGAGVPFDLQVEPHGGSRRFVAQAIGQPPRQARLTEFRFSDLLRRLRDSGPDPLARVPATVQALGLAVLRLVGDDLSGLGDLAQTMDKAEREFVVDEVWPRVLRVREDRSETVLNRGSLLARLRDARAAAEKGLGPLVDLESAIVALHTAVPDEELTSSETGELRAAVAWLEQAKRKEVVQAELIKAAPQGAEIDVRIVGDSLEAEIVLSANALQQDVHEGWQLSAAGLQFAGAGRPWSELQRTMLHTSCGIAATAPRTTLLLDCVLPPSTVGRRFYVIAFRGIACALVVSANDGVFAALVEGDVTREEHVQRAFHRAFAEAMAGPPRARVVAGAVHRLTIEVTATNQRRRARVRLLFEGVELIAPTSIGLEPEQPPTCVIYPQQEIAVRRVLVRAAGL